ncbi:MAG: hypothetical protein LBO09_00420 [Candidatus Peribacteria bacterium]|jgi:hypothetical protein|nr:hypothetical protein [Candidatus Peribacteria bacterium]
MNSLELLFDGIKIESPCVVDPSLLQEFQQGNFRNLWEYKGTTEELTKVLLANPETSEDLKVSMLKTLAKNVRAILKAPENLSKELEKPLDEQKSLDEQKLSHEEAVRNLLKESFDHEKHLNREQLLARGISSLEEFYTTYWEWGESLLLQKTAPLLKKEETDEICYTAEEKLNYIAKCKESLELANLSESKKDEIMNLFYRLLNGYDFSKNN